MRKFSTEALEIADVLLVKPIRFSDIRGYFCETYNAAELSALGLNVGFVQDNESFSAGRGTIRGLHFQAPPDAQAKLVRVLNGAIFDVAVDLRRNSPSYGRWCAATLSAAEGDQLFIPRGFAHGFCTLEENTTVAYKVDSHYAARSDAGLHWSDPDLAISWPVPPQDVVLSEKDTRLPRFADFVSPF